MDPGHYFQSHPPECLAGLVTAASTLFQDSLDESGVYSCFKLSCRCGESEAFVHGFQWQSPEPLSMTLWLSPLILECSRCGKCTLAFDSDAHGRDAELGIRTNRRGEGTRGVFKCQRCDLIPMEINVLLEYAEDQLDGNMPEFAGREQDLFNSFSMFATCTQCLQLFQVANFECD